MHEVNAVQDMTGARPIVQPPVDDLLSKVDSRFTLCTLAAKRSRQITDMINGALGDRGALADVDTVQIRALTSAKPLTVALDEIAAGEISRAVEQPSAATTEPEDSAAEGL